MLTCTNGPRIKPVDNIYPDKSRIKYPLGTILQTRTLIIGATQPESPTEQSIPGLRVTRFKVHE
jgi:hypothetical protein